MFNFLNPYLHLLDNIYAGNTVKTYLIALITFFVLLLLLKITQVIFVHNLKKLAKKTKTRLDDLLVAMIHRVSPPFYFLFSLYFAVRTLQIPTNYTLIIDWLFVALVSYQIIQILVIGVDFTVQNMLCKENKCITENKTLINLIANFFKAILWGIAIIILLSKAGINVSSLVAGLGIGGIAIALAIQNILGDMFGSISLITDKPFVIGDFIIIGNDMGVVKKIGMKTTRIQTLQGEELVVPNKDLISSRIQNFKKMQERRIQFSFGVTYDTKTEKLKKIPEIVKKIVASASNTRFDRAHFKSFGDFSLNFEVVYYLKTGDYNKYMDIQQKINFDIREVFEKEKIEMAFPTQTLFVKKD